MSLSVTQDLDVNVEAPPVYYMGDNLQKEIRKYKYLTDKDNRDKADILLYNEFNKNSLFVHDEATRTYLAYDSVYEYLKNPLPHAHEVIIGTLPQKLKFDIDAESDIIHNLPEHEKAVGSSKFRKREWLFATILSNITMLFKELYHIDLGKLRGLVIVTDQSNVKKFSRHVIINCYCVKNATEAKYFTELLKHRLYKIDSRIVDEKLLDCGVNKDLQNFRIVNCTKVDSDRVKRLITDHEPADCFITNTLSCVTLPSILSPDVADKKYQFVGEISSRIEEILLISAEYLIGHKLREYSGGLLIFDRVAPSHCYICNRIHSSDNTAMIIVSAAGGVYFKCRRSNAESIFIGYIKVERSSFFDYLKSIHIGESNDNKPLPGAKVIKYTSSEVQKIDLSKSDITMVNSPMGTGKTKATVECIKDIPEDTIIVMGSCRQTLTSAFKTAFKGFVDYRDIKGPIRENRVIIQYESLCRLEIQPGKKYIFIIDECQSFIGQDSHKPSGIENGNKTTQVFRWLMHNADKVLMLDANMNYRSYNVAEMTGRSTTVVINEFTRPFNDYYYRTKDELLNEFIRAVKNCKQKPFAFASNSITLLEEYKKIAEDICPDAVIKFYTGDSPDAEKNADLSDVNTAWADADIIMYTSVICQGISYESSRYQLMFAYFTDRSTDYETSTQMLGRFRQCTEFHIYIKSHSAGLPSDWDSLNNILLDEKELAKLKHFGINPYICNKGKIIGPDGRLDFEHKDFQYIMALGNLRHQIQSRNAYLRRFVELRMRMGGTIHAFSVDKFMEEFNQIKSCESAIVGEIKQRKRVAIAGARDLDEKELQEINKGGFVGPEDKKALQKRALANYYGVATEIIDENFVKQYDKHSSKEQFKILNEVADVDDIEAVSQYWNSNSDVFRINKYKAMGSYALWILRQLDPDYRISERKAINRLTLEQKIPEILKSIESLNKYIAVAFGIDIKRLIGLNKRDFKERLECLNSIIRNAFGTSIKMSGTSKVARNIFYITQCGNFIYDPIAKMFKVSYEA